MVARGTWPHSPSSIKAWSRHAASLKPSWPRRCARRYRKEGGPMNVSQLTAMVKAEGADIAEMQLKAVGLASNVAGLAVASMGSRMKAAGLEFFDFDAVSKEFVSNMAESAGVTDAVTPAVEALKGVLASTIPTVEELDAQFAAMRTRFAEVSASADAEGTAMLKSAEAMRADA